MTFTDLTQHFEQLEATSSRLELIAILAKLFAEAQTGDEIEKICYLVQGRVAPFFVPIEFGMAEKQVAQSLATTYGVEKDDVLREYAEVGELSLVAFQLASKANLDIFDNETIETVFKKLTVLASLSGTGSVEKKIQFLKSELFERLDATSVKYIVRIVLGKLRLGIGDPTILDALAVSLTGDRKNRKVLEGAYNRTSALGLVGKTLKEEGLDAVAGMKVRVGFPIRSELCERLPNPTKVIEKMKIVDAQYKYDGFRVQIHKNGEDVRIFSRNLEEMTHMFPELLEAARQQVKAETAILDGEAIAFNPDSEEFLPFQETTKRRRKHNIEETAKELPLKAFIFDILYKDNKSLLDAPLTTRLRLLQETIEGNDVLIPTTSQKIDDPKVLLVMLEDAISRGLEGVVIKKLDSPYEAGGRNFNWVKLKRHSSGELHDTIDCVILGYIYGKGKRAAFGAGALLVGVYDKEHDTFVSVSRIGTGLTDEEWISIKERTKGLEQDHKPARVNSLITPSVWVEPEIVIEVLADEITRSPMHTAGAVIDADGNKEPGYALRFPRLVTFRDADKKAEDATTVVELIQMYNDQGKKE
jgi:DNA ligase-1